MQIVQKYHERVKTRSRSLGVNFDWLLASVSTKAKTDNRVSSINATDLSKELNVRAACLR